MSLPGWCVGLTMARNCGPRSWTPVLLRLRPHRDPAPPPIELTALPISISTSSSASSERMLMSSAALMKPWHACTMSVICRIAGGRHHLDHILACECQVGRVHEVQDGLESLSCDDVQVRDGGLLLWALLHLAVKCLEVAAAAQQHVLVCFENLALHDHTHVAQDAMLPLLVQLPQELPVVRRDLHVFLPVIHWTNGWLLLLNRVWKRTTYNTQTLVSIVEVDARNRPQVSA